MTTAYRLGVLVGDGIGPEIAPASVSVVDAALAAAGAPPVEWVELPMGLAAIEEHGTALPPSTLDALAETDGWLLGPHRRGRPTRSRSGRSSTPAVRCASTSTSTPTSGRRAPSRAAQAMVPDADLVIVRENTEGFYADRNTFAGTGRVHADGRRRGHDGHHHAGRRWSGSRSPRSSWPGAAAST